LFILVGLRFLPELRQHLSTAKRAHPFAAMFAVLRDRNHQNALLYSDTKSKTITDDITGAYTISYLNARLVEECARARRYKTDLDDHSIPDTLRPNPSSGDSPVLSKALNTLLRNTTCLFRRRAGRIILIPNTPLTREGGGRQDRAAVGDMAVWWLSSRHLACGHGRQPLWRPATPGAHSETASCRPEAKKAENRGRAWGTNKDSGGRHADEHPR
jgi:hypothetical protein